MAPRIISDINSIGETFTLKKPARWHCQECQQRHENCGDLLSQTLCATLENGDVFLRLIVVVHKRSFCGKMKEYPPVPSPIVG